MPATVTSADYEAMAPWYEAVTRAVSLGGNARAQRRLLDHVRATDRVLHAGCGSVRFNEELARACESVTAVDISPAMVELARRRLLRAGLDDRVELVCADVTAYEADGPFDVVFANFFLNTFAWEDCRRVLTHLTGLVRPGGLLCIADEAEPRSRLLARPQGLMRRLVMRAHHVWARHPLHGVYDYAPVLAELGFEVVEQRLDACQYIASTVYVNV